MDSEYWSFIVDLNYLSNKFTFFIVVTFLPLAVVLNLFALFVLFSKKACADKTSMVYLLKWQYIVDTILILNIIFVFNSGSLFDYSIATMSDLACGLSNYWKRFIYHLSSWIQVVMSLDRFMSVYLEKRLLY